MLKRYSIHVSNYVQDRIEIFLNYMRSYYRLKYFDSGLTCEDEILNNYYESLKTLKVEILNKINRSLETGRYRN